MVWYQITAALSRGALSGGLQKAAPWAHSLNDTQPQKGSFCAVPRQKCSKDFSKSRVFIRGRSFLTIKDAHRATLQSSFALAHDDSSPSQGEPKRCRRPNASPCLRGGGFSTEGRKDGRVNGEKRIKETHGSEYGRIHLTIHSLKRDLFAPYRVKNARKTSSNVFLKNSSSFSALFSLSGTKISSFETLRGLQP